MFTLAPIVAAGLQAVAATTTQNPASPDIVVQGQRLPSQAQALRAITDMTVIVESQIARFHGPVCPKTIGVGADDAAVLDARMRSTVQSIGAPLAAEGCEPNLLLVLTPDGAAFMKELQDKRPKLLGGMPAPEMRRLMREAPVRAWSVTGLRTEDGKRLTDRGVVSNGTESYAREGNRRLASMGPQVEVSSGSNMRNMTRYVIEGSVVVIDAAATSQLTRTQLADYAVFRGLAKVRPSAEVGVNSILGIFSQPGKDAARELTLFDRRYLGEMYQNLKGKGFDQAVHERWRLAQAVTEGN